MVGMKMNKHDTRMIETATEIARWAIMVRGEVTPMLLLEIDGAISVMPFELEFDENGKDLFVMMAKLTSAVTKAARLAMISEIWGISSKEPKAIELAQEIYQEGRSLKEHPDVQEFVMVLVERHDGYVMVQKPITRSSGSWVSIDQLDEPSFIKKDGPEGQTLGGRFTNLLAPVQVQQSAKFKSMDATYLNALGIKIFSASHIIDQLKAGMPSKKSFN
jgi:hypothetical protein